MSEEKSKTSVARVEQKSPTQVDSFIEQAIAAKAPVETLERLFKLHKEVQAEQAKSAFTQALADFQGECPKIEKNKKVLNKDGRSVRYQYASLDSIGNQIKETLKKHNLSYSWDVEKKDNNMLVTVTVTHVLGHSEKSSIEIPIAVDGYMTEPQKYASAQTYAKRYTLINALGITTADEDTDATDVADQKNAKSPKSRIVLSLRRLGYETDDAEVIKEKVKELTKLPLVEKNYEEIASRLDALVKEKEEYENEQKG